MFFNDGTGVAFGVLIIRVQQMLILSLKGTVELRIMGIKGSVFNTVVKLEICMICVVC